MEFLRKYIFHSPAHYGIAVGLNILIVILMLCSRGANFLLAYVDAFSTAGAVSVLFGLLLLVAGLGAFNIFGFAFSGIRGERKYKDFYEYTVAKEEKQTRQKKIYMPYIVVGLIFLVVSFLLSSFLF